MPQSRSFRRACQICGLKRGRSGVGCYCLPCLVVVRRIAEPKQTWLELLPPGEARARRLRVEAHAARVVCEQARAPPAAGG